MTLDVLLVEGRSGVPPDREDCGVRVIVFSFIKRAMSS